MTRGEGVPDGFGPLESHVPFADAAGPFLRRAGEPPGRAVCGFRVGPEHGNSYAIMHGGCSMSFATVTMTEAAQSLATGRVRLVRMLTNFLAPPHAGDWVEGEAEATAATAGTSIIAVHVRVRVGARTMFTAEAVFAPA